MAETKFHELDAYINTLENRDCALISTLHKAQELYGFLSKDTQRHIARQLSVTTAKVYGVVTFYSFFTMQKKGKYQVSVCTGTACHVRGAASVVQEFEKELGIGVGETSGDGMFSLDCLRCVGACGLAPVVMVGEKVYGRVTPADVRGIVDETLKLEGEGSTKGGENE